MESDRYIVNHIGSYLLEPPLSWARLVMRSCHNSDHEREGGDHGGVLRPFISSGGMASLSSWDMIPGLNEERIIVVGFRSSHCLGDWGQEN